jgi:hypothetical protein
VKVQVLSAADKAYNPNHPDVRITGEAFGFLLYIIEYPNFKMGEENH